MRTVTELHHKGGQINHDSSKKLSGIMNFHVVDFANEKTKIKRACKNNDNGARTAACRQFRASNAGIFSLR